MSHENLDPFYKSPTRNYIKIPGSSLYESRFATSLQLSPETNHAANMMRETTMYDPDLNFEEVIEELFKVADEDMKNFRRRRP